MTTDQDRAAFESAFSKTRFGQMKVNSLATTKNGYVFPATSVAWEMWKAAAARERRRQAQQDRWTPQELQAAEKRADAYAFELGFSDKNGINE